MTNNNSNFAIVPENKTISWIKFYAVIVRFHIQTYVDYKCSFERLDLLILEILAWFTKMRPYSADTWKLFLRKFFASDGIESVVGDEVLQSAYIQKLHKQKCLPLRSIQIKIGEPENHALAYICESYSVSKEYEIWNAKLIKL